MKVFNLDRFPDDYEYSYGDISELSEWDLERIPNGTDAVFYWYASGGYEGNGNMIFKNKGRWYDINMGHCSCYGPTDDMSLGKGYDSLEELEKSGTKEALNEINILIKKAKEEGYK